MNHVKVFILIVAGFFTSAANAEYYISEPSCGDVSCASCYHPHHRYHKRYHHVASTRYYSHRYWQRNSYNVTVNYYYPAVSCGCPDVWVPGQCQCGHWVPGHYQSQGNYVRFEARPAPGSYSFGETYYTPNYSRDRATADDNLPDMEIN